MRRYSARLPAGAAPKQVNLSSVGYWQIKLSDLVVGAPRTAHA